MPFNAIPVRTDAGARVWRPVTTTSPGTLPAALGALTNPNAAGRPTALRVTPATNASLGDLSDLELIPRI